MKRIFAAVLALTLLFALTAAASAETLQIGIPDDGTNLARGIKLLETAGLITVDPAAGYTPELADITGYIYDVDVTPVQANTLPSTLADFGASTINGTYAIPYGLIPSRDGLIIEKQSEEGDNPYVNIIAARTQDVDNALYLKVVEAYQTQLVAESLLGFLSPLPPHGGFELDGFGGNLMPGGSPAVGDFIGDAGPEKHKEIQQRHHRKQRPQEIQSQQVLENGPGEECRVQPRQPFDFHWDDQHNQKLGIRVQHGKGKKHGEIDIGGSLY